MTGFWGICHLTKHQSQKRGPIGQWPRATLQLWWRSCRIQAKTWILGWSFKNQDPTWFHAGNWGSQFGGLLDHRKFRSGNAQGAGDQTTHLEFQRDFMCYIVTNMLLLMLGKHSLLHFCIHIPFIEEMSIGNAGYTMCLIGTIMYCIYIDDGIKKVFIK